MIFCCFILTAFVHFYSNFHDIDKRRSESVAHDVCLAILLISSYLSREICQVLEKRSSVLVNDASPRFLFSRSNNRFASPEGIQRKWQTRLLEAHSSCFVTSKYIQQFAHSPSVGKKRRSGSVQIYSHLESSSYNAWTVNSGRIIMYKSRSRNIINDIELAKFCEIHLSIWLKIHSLSNKKIFLHILRI